VNRPSLPPALEAATDDQPAARAGLAAALAAGPSHAYLFAGPAPAAMRSTARAFAAELLAAEAPDPDSARTRAMADPSPHPDLVWLTPAGGQHLVEEVREQVIRAVAYRPFEGARRVFVIEQAEAMADESQNALLKTLEEPPPYAHLLLLSAEPAGLRATVASRCQRIGFQPLTPEAIEERLRALPVESEDAGDASEPELRAAARLSGGDLDRARFLVSDPGRELRAAVESYARAIRKGAIGDSPWLELLRIAEAEGEEAGREALDEARERAEQSGEERAKARIRKLGEEAAKRSSRRRRTETLDLALALMASWFRDLAATGENAAVHVLHADRVDELSADAAAIDPRRAREAAEWALEMRRRLRVNVSEELALEALFYRAQDLLATG
jgi:DNA polymerase-3 subunit delta'